jgi:hypothetical protein
MPPSVIAPRGAPPLPLPRGGPPPGASVTSPHSGDDLDDLRTAVMGLQHYSEKTSDDQELAQVHKCILAIQNILASHAKNQDAAMGTTPAMRHVRRVSGGNY